MTMSDEHTTEPFQVILASKSPRRRELLSEAGISYTVRSPSQPVDETLEPDDLALPAQAAKKLAEKKAGAVIQDMLAEDVRGLFMVIGADTMVVLDGKIFGKPKNLDDAKRMLAELADRTHEVITAVSVWLLSSQEDEGVSLAYRTFADESRVTFKKLDDETIAAYLARGESFDKAGAYAIQGEGRALIERYEGALDTIIGLPVERLIKEFPDIRPA